MFIQVEGLPNCQKMILIFATYHGSNISFILNWGAKAMTVYPYTVILKGAKKSLRGQAA